jgi:hypothetical protein
MPTQGKQVATIAGHQYLDFGRGRTGEDQVVVGVAADRLGPAHGSRDEFGRKVDEHLLDGLPSVGLEADLLGQDPLQLDKCRSGQDKLELAVDRLLEDPTRWPRRDEGRDEDVGVAGDPQDQRRPRRDSSTTASISSGPMPIGFARPRP